METSEEQYSFFSSDYFKYLFLSVFCSLGYPILFILAWSNNKPSMILCSFIHAFFSAIVMYRVVSKLLLEKPSKINMATMFILINLLYFSASSVKYFEPELYIGFINNSVLRLYYSLLGLAVVWLSFEIVIRIKTRYKYQNFNIYNRHLLKMVIALLLFYIFLNIIDLYHKGFGSAYSSDLDPIKVARELTSLPMMEKIRIWMNDFINMVLVLLLALHFGKRKNKILIVIAIIAIFIISLFSGHRGIIFYFFFGIAFSLVYLYDYGSRFIARIFLAAPLIIGIGSVLMLTVSNRFEYKGELLKHQLAYRFDLTDYAATLIHKRNQIILNIEIVSDAIYYSIPKVLYPSKYEANKKSAIEQLDELELDKCTDYTDTFFSIGAQLGGIIGFLIIPFSMVLFFYGLEKLFFLIFPFASYLIVIIMYPLYLTIETDLNSLLAAWRMLPIYILFGSILYWLFVKPDLLFKDERVKEKFMLEPAK